MPLRSILPRMFHRRLFLLACAAGAVYGALALQGARLTLARGAELRARAEDRLINRTWLPTVRGRILDRKGRILAQDKPSYDLTVGYTAITGEWARARSWSAARRAARHRWAEMSESQRRELADRLRPAYDRHLAEAWAYAGRELGLPATDLDARRADVIASVTARHEAVTRARRESALAKARATLKPDEVLTVAQAREIDRQASGPIREQTAAHSVAARLSDEVALRLDIALAEQVEIELGEGPDGEIVRDRVERLPEFRLRDVGEREYPLETIGVEIDRRSFPGPLAAESPMLYRADGVAVQVIGWMRDGVRAEDAGARAERLRVDAELRELARDEDGVDRGEYREFDRVGHSGVEASMEHDLRGLRGRRIRHLDTGAVSVTPAEPGRDVRLTIDALLQARIQAVMSPELGLGLVQPWNASPRLNADGTPNPAYLPPGTPLAGACVVLEIDTGDVLAMVSTPTFSRRDLREEPDRVFASRHGQAFLNRAIARPYPPGSIAKALVLAGASVRGVYAPGDRIACHGHLFPGDENVFRCWIFKRTQGAARVTHSAQFGHDLNAPEALMVSCNIFFYTLGMKLGPAGIAGVYRDFGVGAAWDLGIGQEYPGAVGGAPRGTTSEGTWSLTAADAAQMGIGQGPVDWTPLHAADAYATLARAGVRVTPRVVVGRPTRTPDPPEVPLTPDVLREAMEGLGRSVNDERGTGHHILLDADTRETTFNAPGVWVWGKTGTAAGQEVIDPDGDGPEPGTLRQGDHSWYVILVGRHGERPLYAVAVLMEYAGSGGKVSGPIANQVVYALMAEGYL